MAIQSNNPILLLLFISILLLSFLVLYAWVRRYERAARIFLGTVLSLLVWTTAFLFEIAVPSLREKLYWANVQFLGITFLPLSLLALSLYYTQRKSYSLRLLLALGVIPLLTNIMIWTNDFHHLFRGQPSIDVSGVFPMLYNDYGPWFYWIHSVYSYLLLLVGVLLLVRSLVFAKPFYRQQIVALLVSILLPLIADLLYVFGFSPIPRFNLSPVVFSFSAVLLGWAQFRFRLFDLLPPASEIVIECMQEGVIVLDNRKRVVDMNPAARRILNVSDDRFVGKPAGQALYQIPELPDLLKSDLPVEIEIQLDNGLQTRQFNLHSSPVKNFHQHAAGWVIILHDVSELKELYETVNRLATIDALTGIYNRRYFLELAEKELLRARRYQQSVSLIMMDLDQFKLVNDTHGHQMGDRVLRAVAQTCLHQLRAVDLIGRYGGEELIMLLPNSDAVHAQNAAERLCQSVRKLAFEVSGLRFSVTASFGIACYTGEMLSNSMDDLLSRADRALYAAKHAGRNCVKLDAQPDPVDVTC